MRNDIQTPVSLITIIAPNKAAAAALERALALAGQQEKVSVGIAEKPDTTQFHVASQSRTLEVPAPARLGLLLYKAQTLSESVGSGKSLVMGPYTLDLIEKTWRADHGESIALTDREVALLEALINAPGHVLDRSVLLERVWGYHKDAETHTLETHIYRLRRKLENDAANPEILLTEGASYKLAAEEK